MDVQAERRLAAIMFTDIVGYTALAQTNEARTLQQLEEHRAVLRSVFLLHNGREVKTIGDAFLVEFPSALDAVQCAVEIQKRMRERNAGLDEDQRLAIRVGVHLGDVVHREGDLLGDAVNVSSRIEPLAPPGGVCISEQVYDHVRNKVGLPLEKLEGKTLKNVKLPIDVYRIVMPWEVETRPEAEQDTRRVAVLPLKNMSPDPNDEYFADGMTEELITALASVTELTVIARTSIMQYKNAPKRIADIGRELNVGTLVEGSVRKAANKVRITIQLIDARNEGHLWAQNYDKQLDDIFAIQSEVAQKVADTLKVQILESRRQKLERGSTRNPEAYTLYLKGMFHWNKRTSEGLKKSVELFEEAVKLDPTFALGYAGVALACQVMAANYVDEPVVYYPKAKEYAIRALSLDDDLAEAHTVLGAHACAFDHDLEKGESEFKRAIELNPSYPTGHQWYSHLLIWEKRFDEATREIYRAFELSPLSLVINSNLANLHYYKGEYTKAIEIGEKLLEMDPTFSTTYYALLPSYIRTGKLDKAEKAAEECAKTVSPTLAKAGYAYLYASTGRPDRSRTLLAEVEQVYRQEHVNPYSIAMTYFLLGDNDKGFEWLERSYSEHDMGVNFLAVDPELSGARSDPRYLEMLNRIGLAARLKG